jgi:phosphopantothenoylcysteine decarboxylase/phosphopantothenate--cysteine ligase
MNVRMWANPAIRRAVDTLRGDGHHVLDPAPVASRSSRIVGSGVGEIPGAVMATVAAHARAGIRETVNGRVRL